MVKKAIERWATEKLPKIVMECNRCNHKSLVKAKKVYADGEQLNRYSCSYCGKVIDLPQKETPDAS